MIRAWLLIALAAPPFLLSQAAAGRTSDGIQQDLITAIVSEDYGRVETLARARKRRLIRPVQEGESWNPAFFRIVERASPQALAIFLADKDYRDAENNWGWNWFQYAISRRVISAYWALARSGIDLRHMDSAGYTALHHAALRGDRAAVRVLLDMDIPVDIRATTGQTPLMVAVAGARLGIVELLLASGADLALQDRNGDSAMHFSVRTGDRRLLELLVARGGNLEQPAENGWTPRQELAHWFPDLLDAIGHESGEVVGPVPSRSSTTPVPQSW
jgi:hypothetical protein